MSRRIHSLVALALVLIALAAAACAESTAPPSGSQVSADILCDYTSNPTCHH
jgi:outer membrane lipoprotein-sorting protein